jgi:hypothetical protein
VAVLFQSSAAPDWHFNALDGRRVEDTRHWSEIDIGSIHDVKFVWEPNRFSVTYLLARAYASARDGRYAEAFWNLVEDWASRNPPNRGVNWASGQEGSASRDGLDLRTACIFKFSGIDRRAYFQASLDD